MTTPDAGRFHQLHGVKNPRISYFERDFVDYALMTAISAAVIYLSYGGGHWMTLLGIVLCAVMIVGFPVRHGVQLRMPLLLRRPQDLIYMLVHKIGNVKPVWLLAVAILALENLFIYLTPDLPHHVEQMRTVGLWLFFAHFIGLTAYRTFVLIEHLRKRALVREVLQQTSWKKYLARQPNITLQILHAYFTGVLTHIVLIAPWYLVITYASFSVIALPVTCALNLFVQYQFFKVINDWFYRDHWLGHNSEFEFLYLHGTHHDAIPCGLIGVAGNGFLEGFFRYAIAFPTTFFNPVISFFVFTFVVKQDIDTHQYVPGVFPKLAKAFHEVTQHSTHHYGCLEPYSLGVKSDQLNLSEAAQAAARNLTRGFPTQLRNSIELDERLTGFKWNNSVYRKFLELLDRYQK
jgi:hypothetical protein